MPEASGSGRPPGDDAWATKADRARSYAAWMATDARARTGRGRPVDRSSSRSSCRWPDWGCSSLGRRLDHEWEHHPSHFWLVLITAGCQRGPGVRHQRRRRSLPRCPPGPDLARVPVGGRVPGPARARDARRPARAAERRVRHRHPGRARPRIDIRRCLDQCDRRASRAHVLRASGRCCSAVLLVLMVVWGVLSLARAAAAGRAAACQRGGRAR